MSLSTTDDEVEKKVGASWQRPGLGVEDGEVEASGVMAGLVFLVMGMAILSLCMEVQFLCARESRHSVRGLRTQSWRRDCF